MTHKKELAVNSLKTVGVLALLAGMIEAGAGRGAALFASTMVLIGFYQKGKNERQTASTSKLAGACHRLFDDNKTARQKEVAEVVENTAKGGAAIYDSTADTFKDLVQRMSSSSQS